MARKSQRLRRQRRIERMKAKKQEEKMNKVVEDNSVVLERMKNVSNSCDKLLQTFNITNNINEDEEEINLDLEEEIDIRAPLLKINQPEPEFKETPVQVPNLKKMTKKSLLNLAKDLDIKVTPSMTKAIIIKTIEAKQ